MMVVLDERSTLASDRVQELKEGDTVITPGVDGSVLETPPWLNKEKFYRAGDVYRKYFAGVNFAHLCGLLLSFYFTKNIETLKSTGMSSSTKNLFNRYLATVRYVQSWYEGDVWNPKDKAHQILTTVRSMHAKAANRMAAKEDGIVYVSQWDMALTQWAFIGPIILFPSQVGLHGCSKEEFDSLIHFWRGIGFLLGIEDKYNLCNGSYDKVVEACEEILHREYAMKVCEAHPSSVAMCCEVTEAFTQIDPLLTWGFLSNYIHDMIQKPCPIPMSFYDWICYEITRFMMGVAAKFTMMRLLLNEVSRWRLDKAESEQGPYGKIKIYKFNDSTNVKGA